MNMMKQVLLAMKRNTLSFLIVVVVICAGVTAYIGFASQSGSNSENKAVLKQSAPSTTSTQTQSLPVTDSPDEPVSSPSTNTSGNVQGQGVQLQPAGSSQGSVSSGQPTQTPSCSECPVTSGSESSDTLCPDVACAAPIPPPTTSPTPTPVPVTPHCAPCGIREGGTASSAIECPMYCVE